MTRNCGENSTMSRRLFIESLFDRGLVDEHYGDVVADGINTFTLDAFQRVPIGLELDLRLASRTREYLQEFLTNCHGLTFLSGMLRECESLPHRHYMTYNAYLTYTFPD